MAVFVSSKSTARRHGVYAIEVQSAATVRATGSAQAAIVAQFPWGPSDILTSAGSMKELIDMVAPAGMSRLGSGYLSLIRKGWPVTPRFVRVKGSGAAAATATVVKSGPANMLTLTLKYNGTAGNACVATVAAASDGNSNHFNLTVSVSDVYGNTTTDLVQNLNYSGTGSDSAPDLSKALLLGSISKLASGLPTPGAYTFSGGADGSVIASTYTGGTVGTTDHGINLLEADRSIDAVFVDDCGPSLRATVNAQLQAHADYMTDRVAYINGNQGQTAAQAQSDAANYASSLRTCYVDAWAYIVDDTLGAKTLVPPAAFAASVACQLSPSTSIAWKGQPVQNMLSGIVDLEADRGEQAATNTQFGVTTLMRELTGGYTFEAAVVCANATTPSKGLLTRTRMGHYIARSVVTSLRPNVDAPNVALIQNDEIAAVDTFLMGLKRNASVDPIGLPHIVDYSMKDPKSQNTSASIAAGEYSIGADIQTSSSQEKIFFNMNYGPTVAVTATL